MTEILPKATFESVDDICIKMRMVKTPEEIALIQRAMNYWSKIHAFARDYTTFSSTAPMPPTSRSRWQPSNGARI